MLLLFYIFVNVVLIQIVHSHDGHFPTKSRNPLLMFMSVVLLARLTMDETFPNLKIKIYESVVIASCNLAYQMSSFLFLSFSVLDVSSFPTCFLVFLYMQFVSLKYHLKIKPSIYFIYILEGHMTMKVSSVKG